jgi:dihydropteroate synthase
MGVINVTPDSFADGGQRLDPARAVADAVAMEAQGADIIDVGGESTRPGADPLPVDAELARIEPVVRGLAKQVRVPISIDTYKARVAHVALDLGATLVNDISALSYDPALAQVVADRRAAVILMHTRGRSRDMYRQAEYGDVVEDVRRELDERCRAATTAGIPSTLIIVDPGIGFAKRAEHSSAIIARLQDMATLGHPVLTGVSRKSFLTRAIGERSPGERDFATAAAVTACVLAGAHVVRVHDVPSIVDAVRVADMIRRDGGLDHEDSP